MDTSYLVSGYIVVYVSIWSSLPNIETVGMSNQYGNSPHVRIPYTGTPR